jgi:hypothetical protein
MLAQDPTYAATATATPTGAQITITSRAASDTAVVARIRGLGLNGLMTEGDHHGPHHLAIARGNRSAHAH